MRIALFTPFSPDLGGGSVQFRSLLPEFRDLDIEWFYLAKNATPGPKRNWLGTAFTTGQFLSELCGRTGFLPGSKGRTKQLAELIQADMYWIVAHNEGILLADELCARGKRVHLSVHDDPISMFKKSRKYLLFTPLISLELAKLLKSVESADVISPFMRDAYRRKYQIDCKPVYRFVRELAQFPFRPARETLTVGHIGSVYDPEPFRNFMKACQAYAAEQNRPLKLVRVGSSPEMDMIATENSEVFESRGELEEQEALPILANCDFLYAMYPPGKRFQAFRRQSLPMKLSTYVQAQRPIFAHTPDDSSLAQVVNRYRVGCVCTSNDRVELKNKIGMILSSPVGRERFELLRDEMMGERQIQELRTALTRDKQ
jgi:hypothetical protein